MGMIHALHIHELAQESDLCRLTAVSTLDKQAADKFHSLIDAATPVFENIEALAKSDACDVVVIATNTDSHRDHSLMMIRAGKRVFQEKPLTGTLEATANMRRCWSASIRMP
jgi:predicted dehydrogenase